METDNVPVQYMLVPEEDQVKVENTKQILVIEDDVVDLWHTVGATQNLSTDVDICRFLLSLYVSRGPGAPQYSSRCSHCNAILTPICINCNLPSRPSSQQTPPAQQASQGSRHQTQHDPFQQTSAPSAASARPASPEDSGGWHLPENDDDDSDGAGGLDMEVYGDDAGDVSAVEMERPGGKGPPKQDKKQVLAKVSYPKIPSKILKKRKGSRVTVAAKRKSTRGSPASSKTSTKICDSSERIGEGKVTDHTCTTCDSKFMSKRALSSHMNRSLCKSAPLQKVQSNTDAQASESETTSDPSQQGSSHPEAETSKEKESTQEQSGGDKAADKEEHSMQSKDGHEEIPEAEVAVAGSSGSAAPGVCHHCGKSFCTYKNLKRHIRQVHCQGEPVVCPEPGCGKSFLRPELLERHRKNKHSDEKPFQCKKCKKTFAMRKSLTQHIHSCGGLKPYVCILCTMAFASRSSLADHRSRSHEGRRFFCRGCSKVFNWKASLNRHVKKCPSAE